MEGFPLVVCIGEGGEGRCVFEPAFGDEFFGEVKVNGGVVGGVLGYCYCGLRRVSFEFSLLKFALYDEVGLWR